MSLLALSASSAASIYIEDVFLINTRSGTGGTVSVTGGPTMSVSGGMLTTKARSTTTGWRVVDTSRGATKSLDTSATSAEATETTGLTSFNTDGATFGADTDYNASGQTFVDYFFRNASKFFTHTSAVKSPGSNATVDLSALGTVGMVKVKRTDSAGSWYVWHRSLTAGKLLVGETNAAEATLGHITVSGTTLTLVDGVIADGTYHVEAYAHDTSSTGLIQCGSYTGTGSSGLNVSLGCEPQFLLVKNISATSNWQVFDVQRGMTTNSSSTTVPLTSNLASAEGSASAYLGPTATGFTLAATASVNASGNTFVYVAIRRGPMRSPTSGTQVYQAITRTGTGAIAAITGVGFPPDLVIGKQSNSTQEPNFTDRLRGATYELLSSSTAAEAAFVNDLTAFGMDGISLGTGASGRKNTNTSTYIEYFFRRYPGFMDVVCYTGAGGAGQLVSHNLTVVPELMIPKGRSVSSNWITYHAPLGPTKYLHLNGNQVVDTLTSAWNDTAPTSTNFTVGSTAGNAVGETYVMYLFATLPGISKISSYTGTGTTLQIDCGFAAGARFVLIKRSDSSGDWYLWDSVRGIVSGNDPYLLLNTTAAEVTSTDYIDPYAAGFEISSSAPSAINASGGTFQYFAIA